MLAPQTDVHNEWNGAPVRKLISTQKIVGFVVTACLLVMVGSAWAQRVSLIRRITFAPGQTSTILRARVKPSSNHVYRLYARSGQHMAVRLQAPNNDVVFWVQSKKYIQGRDTLLLEGVYKGGVVDWSGELPATGGYEIYVSNPPINDHPVKRALPYELAVEIR